MDVLKLIMSIDCLVLVCYVYIFLIIFSSGTKDERFNLTFRQVNHPNNPSPNISTFISSSATPHRARRTSQTSHSRVNSLPMVPVLIRGLEGRETSTELYPVLEVCSRQQAGVQITAGLTNPRAVCIIYA